MSHAPPDRGGLAEALVADGRPPLKAAALVLILCGGFAVFQSATGHFLPHDVAYLGMDAGQLCAVHECRIVLFMFHDRVAFAGVLAALGLLYLWLAEFPLRAGEAWAWWALAMSAAAGFAGFLTYLGTGYLDAWHGVATAFLMPLFAVGLARSRRLVPWQASIAALLRPGVAVPWRSAAGIGRALLLATGAGQIGAGATIAAVGMTRVFVPQDLVYMDLSPADLRALSPRLIPLIAHDRAGFGGALLACGLAWLLCVWCARPSRSLWQTLLVAGCAGFAAAIGVHVVVGYLDLVHLAPALAGALVFAIGMALSFAPMCARPPVEGAPCSA
jgi:hypothetical protein